MLPVGFHLQTLHQVDFRPTNKNWLGLGVEVVVLHNTLSFFFVCAIKLHMGNVEWTNTFHHSTINDIVMYLRVLS